MWVIFINLLIRYTNCIIITNDRKIVMEWMFRNGSFTLNLIAPDGTRIIRVDANTIRLVPYFPRKKTLWCRLKQSLRVYLKKYVTGLPWIQNML